MENNEGIDFRRLEKEMACAIEADARYQRENSAKFRAVEQRVGSYEEFRDIVAASHLKPLDRKDITGKKERLQPWNLHASKEPMKDNHHSQGVIPSQPVAVPQTAHDFTRHWRRLCKTKDDKYRFLCEVGGKQMAKIFKAEISLGLLGEFIEVLSGCWKDANSVDVFCILSSLTKTNRFSLTLQFLSSTERYFAAELFNKLSSICTVSSQDSEKTEDMNQVFTAKDVTELAGTYGVHL